MVHEDKLSAVLADFARTMITDFPIQQILDRLVHRIVQILPVSAAGVTLVSDSRTPRYVAASDEAAMRFERLQAQCGEGPCLSAYDDGVADPRGTLHVAAASSNNTRHLETFQVQQAEGPCLDCYATGEPVSVPDLGLERARWPRFVEAAHLAGFASVHAVPLRLPARTLGAMGLFGTSPGDLGQDDLRLAQALADVASVALVHERAATDNAAIIEQLQHALDSRIVIEQAKGVIAQTGKLTVDDAFKALRRYCRDRNLKLSETARQVAHRQLPATEILVAVSTRDTT